MKGLKFWCGVCTFGSAVLGLVCSVLGAKNQEAQIQEASKKAVEQALLENKN